MTVFDRNPVPGGMLTLGIPSFRLEKDVVNAEIEVLREMGVHFQCGVEIGKDLTIDQLREQGYLAFYVAIGCQGGRLPGVPGEHAAGTDIAVHFLHEALADENGDLIEEYAQPDGYHLLPAGYDAWVDYLCTHT